jgi:hypothetical protein
MKKEILNIKRSEEMTWNGLTGYGCIQHVIWRYSKYSQPFSWFSSLQHGLCLLLTVKIWPNRSPVSEEWWSDWTFICHQDTLCGLLVDVHGCLTSDQKCVIKSTSVQTGLPIMIGNIVQQSSVTIALSLMLCYMVFNNTHASLLRKKLKRSQESVQFRLPLKTYILIDPQKTIKVEF